MELDRTSETMAFHVEGMTCAHCTSAVSDAVQAVDGVSDVSVDLDQQRVTVRGAELAQQVVLDAITHAGYDARRA